MTNVGQIIMIISNLSVDTGEKVWRPNPVAVKKNTTPICLIQKERVVLDSTGYQSCVLFKEFLMFFLAEANKKFNAVGAK